MARFGRAGQKAAPALIWDDRGRACPALYGPVIPTWSEKPRKRASGSACAELRLSGIPGVASPQLRPPISLGQTRAVGASPLAVLSSSRDFLLLSNKAMELTALRRSACQR